MLSTAQVVIPAILAVCAIEGYVIWKSRRRRSRPGSLTPTAESVETSEFGQGTLVVSRCLVAVLIGIFGFGFWNDHSIIAGARSAEAACVWFLVVSSLIGLSWYMLGVLTRSSSRALSFDNDGLWRTQVGKEQGLVRWSNICSVKERSSALSLFDRDGRLMLEVEYERDGYFRIRTQIMERMSFHPPQLPLDVSAAGANVPGSVRLAFACAALLSAGIGVLSTAASRSYILVPLFLCCAVAAGLLAIPRLKVTIGVAGITIRRRTYPYSAIRSIEASFLTIRGQRSPRLTLDVSENKPDWILTKGLAIDSLTLQRTVLWALARASK
jgi:hypothetical protein